VKGWRPTPADGLTLARLVAVPILWGLAGSERPVALGIGIAIAGLTDVLDGPVARRTGSSSRIGSQLDSAADLLLMASIVAWIAWLRPDFLAANVVPLAVWGAIGTASLIATWVRFGRVGNLHLYSAKVAGVVGYVFVVWLFVLGDYSRTFFAIAVGLAILGATETLLIALTRERADESVVSILSRRR
jgi:CDP-diacylglycerol---glycerol-3-phosphate 3-phosphatidyltransferase